MNDIFAIKILDLISCVLLAFKYPVPSSLKTHSLSVTKTYVYRESDTKHMNSACR